MQNQKMLYDIFIHEIMKNKDSSLTYTEKVLAYVEENKLDPYEIADIIKEDKTLFSLIEHEALKSGFLKTKQEQEFDLSSLFDD